MNQTTSTSRAVNRRDPTLDVARAVAMIGVVILNYHSYLNGDSAWFQPFPSFGERLFNPGTGVLTTRFAAVFVLVAGAGVSLLTRTSRSTKDPQLLRQDRLILLRRGVLLYSFGYFLQWIWPGTILFYYGAFFIVAALIFAAPTRNILTIAAASAIAAAAIAWWRIEQSFDGNPTSWLAPANVDSPRNLLIRTFVSYTHPLFPWLLFFLFGMILGRHLIRLAEFRQKLMLWSGATLYGTYLLNFAVVADPAKTNHERLIAMTFSTRPYDRGLLYSIGTLASSVLALCVISIVVEFLRENSVVDALARAGQMSLSIYLAHILFFNLIVHRLHLVGSTGLDTALGLSFLFYAMAIPMSALWRKYIGRGPAEVVYRSFGG
ncbi:MAG: DUF418 domain-containing protein [Ilumatobacteraceae bacterium]